VDAVEAVLNILEDDRCSTQGVGQFSVRRKERAGCVDHGWLESEGGRGGERCAHAHPISLARAVMEKSPYVMMDGPGADAFGARVGLEQVDPSFFFTEARWQGLVKQLTKEGKPVPPRPAGAPPPGAAVPVAFYDEGADPHSHGTTGVVALTAMATLPRAHRRVGCREKCRDGGDSPIWRAGLTRQNQSCAVRLPDSGEYFIRLGVRGEICSPTSADVFSATRDRQMLPWRSSATTPVVPCCAGRRLVIEGNRQQAAPGGGAPAGRGGTPACLPASTASPALPARLR